MDKDKKKQMEEAMKMLRQTYGPNVELLDEDDFDTEYELGCSACGECCRDRNDVIISAYALREIAKGLNEPVKEIVKKYMYVYVGERSKLVQMTIDFREKFGGGTICPFLKKKEDKFLCKIHAFKPATCRVYPFGKMSIGNVKTGQDKTKLFVIDREGLKCPNADEYHMIKASEWTGSDKFEEEQKWSGAFSERVGMIAELKGFKECVEYDKVLMMLAMDFTFYSDTSISDEEAFEKYKTISDEDKELLENIKAQIEFTKAKLRKK